MATDHSAPLKEGKLKIVGTRPIRPDGIDKVTGRAKFGADLYLPGMLFGEIGSSGDWRRLAIPFAAVAVIVIAWWLYHHLRRDR